MGLDNRALDAVSEPPLKKLKIQDRNSQEVKCLAKREEFDSITKQAIEVEEDQHGCTDQQKTVDLLGKLYPTWVGVLQALEDPSQLVDVMSCCPTLTVDGPSCFQLMMTCLE